MFCPNCGAEATAGLNYCKHCGGILAEPQVSQSSAEPKNILAALILALSTIAIILGGLSIVFHSVLSLVGPQTPGFTPPAREGIFIAALMVLFGSGAIIVSTFLLIKLFSKVMGFDSQSSPSSQKALQPGVRAARIPAPPSAMLTVTEHTTRNFEPRVFQRNTGE